MSDWVASDVAAYVDRAVVAAADIAGLVRLRAGFRERFRASALGGDPADLARVIEVVYRSLWRDHCRR
jgi:predicted O-linked N-acetylglucosamine transferase (SPINDLY family)